MISDTSGLPNDPVELKKIIANLHKKQQQYSSEIELLREQVSHLYNKLFGRKSEKNRYAEESPQLPLFDMPEPDPDQENPAAKQTEVKGHIRTKGKRKPLPAKLPRVDVVHDIAEEGKVCHCGAQLCRIGEEVSEKLDIIPAVIQVIRHIRPKYSCKQCENIAENGATVKIAPCTSPVASQSNSKRWPYGAHSDG